MCGVAGFLNLNGREASRLALERMSRAIAHRGPDGAGHWIDGPIGLGHRRLSILDLSAAGAQPMISADGRFVISYGGEVYNFKELRRALESRGRVFRSTSDTEVVLEAFAEWGASAITRFNGMFSLALWDRKERKLLLARDRYGVKPLYVARTGNALIFGSEVKAILAHGDLAPKLNLAGLAEYMTFQNFFSDQTLFADVSLLPPGTMLEITADGRTTSRRYWDFHFRDEADAPKEALVDELEENFSRAVNRNLVSDVPVGTYLSGGIDTGSITAVAAKSIPNICSYTIGFDLTSASGLELGFDERQNAERMSYLFRTEHYEMVLKAGDMERCFSDLVWHVEEPRVGVSYPNFYASKLASRFGKVVLAGTGGDELFAGYPWRYWRSVMGDSFDHYIDDYYQFWQRMLPADAYQKVLAPVSGDLKNFDSRAIFRSVFTDPPERLTGPEDYVNRSLYFEAKTFLHGVLTVEDKLSMAHGLEARVPMLDNDLVDLACRIPVRHKLAGLDRIVRLDENVSAKPARYYEKTRDGKLIMRDMTQRYVTSDVTEGFKQGFSGPDSSWYRGESIDYVRRKLFSPRAKIYDYLDHGAVTGFLNEHMEGRANWRLLIWSLLYLEEFLETFMSGSARVRGLALN